MELLVPVLSDMTGVDHRLKIWGKSSKEQRRWWLDSQCKTSPPLPPLTGAALAVDDVCYMVLYGGFGTPKDDDAWTAFLHTWPTRIKGGTSRVYRVLSAAKVVGMETDGKEAINGTGRVDHTQCIVCLPIRETYSTLSVKSLAMWRYVSRSFISDGWSTRCAWFVKVDTDSWVNAPLLEARLGCLSPDQAIYSGFERHGYGWGGFYLVSREVVRLLDGQMDSFLVHNHLPYNAEDFLFGTLMTSINVLFRLIATFDEYVFGLYKGGGKPVETFTIYRGKEVAEAFHESLRNDQVRVCTLAMHPIKSVSKLKATDTLWESLTKKLPQFFGQTLQRDLCFSSNVLPEQETRYDLIREMMACTKRKLRSVP